VTPRTGPPGPRDDGVTHRYRSQAAYALAVSIRNRKAIQVVAAQADDLEDCVELLAMLGLDARETLFFPGPGAAARATR
jgi:hypothetical protein